LTPGDLWEPGDRRGAGGDRNERSEWRRRLLPLLFVSHRWQESKAERPARSAFRGCLDGSRFRSPATLGEFQMGRRDELRVQSTLVLASQLETRPSKLATR